MTFHETHIPTEQNQTSKSMRLSKENGHGKRAKDRQPPASSRTQALDHSVKFPKTARILLKRHFQRIMKAGTKLSGFHIMIHYRAHSLARPRLGITVSKKHGKAHERNRFKRVVREAFRHCQHSLPQDIEINVMPLHRKSIDMLSVIKDFLQFSERLKKIHGSRPSE
jgi:ribonuclease P protein component